MGREGNEEGENPAGKHFLKTSADRGPVLEKHRGESEGARGLSGNKKQEDVTPPHLI